VERQHLQRIRRTEIATGAYLRIMVELNYKEVTMFRERGSSSSQEGQ